MYICIYIYMSLMFETKIWVKLVSGCLPQNKYKKQSWLVLKTFHKKAMFRWWIGTIFALFKLILDSRKIRKFLTWSNLFIGHSLLWTSMQKFIYLAAFLQTKKWIHQTKNNSLPLTQNPKKRKSAFCSSPISLIFTLKKMNRNYLFNSTKLVWKNQPKTTKFPSKWTASFHRVWDDFLA